jgi:hypothetical protein
VLVLGYFAFTLRPPAPGTAAAPRLDSPPELHVCLMDRDGYLTGRLFGAIDFAVDWVGSALSCDGNARPGDQGLRLFFAGAPGNSAERLVIVLGIGTRIENLNGEEHDANLTIIDEARDRFYNSGANRCWTRVFDVVPLAATPDQVYRVDGEIYCAGAIPSLTDTTSITPGTLSYSGRLTLGD